MRSTGQGMEWSGDLRRRKRKEINMQILELRPYDPESDAPRSGWDALSVDQAMAEGIKLYVDQFGDIWTGGRREYVGRIRKERTEW